MEQPAVSLKANLFVGGVLAGLLLITSLVMSWATGDWGPLIGCLIALGIAAVIIAITNAVCLLGEKLFPWDDQQK